jgi:hypothetical protein
LQVPCQTRPRCSAFQSPDKDQAFGGIAVAQTGAGRSEKATVRSVRTRRSARSSRGRTAEKIAQGFRNGRNGNEFIGCRFDYVSHSTSPSRRENARRAIRSPVFQSQSAATERPLCSTLRRRVPQSVVFNTFASSAFPIVASSASISFPLSGARFMLSATPGNLDTKLPFSYCYESPTQLRLESVANAHTAADLHVRSWVSYRAGQESLERRERVTNTPSAISDNP